MASATMVFLALAACGFLACFSCLCWWRGKAAIRKLAGIKGIKVGWPFQHSGQGVQGEVTPEDGNETGDEVTVSI
eukprot:CAMPEP_0176190868 /NCGR_PEP_ID=MMETSP0121_2-20121125/4168_1 /TAXON_ID=160619 /ORGANISM="Kryptoperidinium foliaceum, Strain CCMP 1326" /LENGTH=74 /DNA_ID=CAMNT_0017529519 /DNA_START=18 /DNA_END=242 /DNA_ORIENTATION=-